MNKNRLVLLILIALFLSGCSSTKKDQNIVRSECIEPVFSGKKDGACFERSFVVNEDRLYLKSPLTGHKKSTYICQISKDTKKFHVLSVVRLTQNNKTITSAFISRIDIKNGEPTKQTILGRKGVETLNYSCSGEWRDYIAEGWDILQSRGLLPLSHNGLIGESKCEVIKRRYSYTKQLKSRLRESYKQLRKYCGREKAILNKTFAPIL